MAFRISAVWRDSIPPKATTEFLKRRQVEAAREAVFYPKRKIPEKKSGIFIACALERT